MDALGDAVFCDAAFAGEVGFGFGDGDGESGEVRQFVQAFHAFGVGGDLVEEDASFALYPSSVYGDFFEFGFGESGE